MKNSQQQVLQLFTRIAIGSAYFIYGADRLGLWGKPGDKNVAWGDWEHFMARAEKVMGFLPHGLIGPFAVIATVAEISLGILLIAGYKTKYAAFGGGILAFLFATSMAISFGILSPLGSGVFAVCAACFLLQTIPAYSFSVDALLKK